MFPITSKTKKEGVGGQGDTHLWSPQKKGTVVHELSHHCRSRWPDPCSLLVSHTCCVTCCSQQSEIENPSEKVWGALEIASGLPHACAGAVTQNKTNSVNISQTPFTSLRRLTNALQVSLRRVIGVSASPFWCHL